MGPSTSNSAPTRPAVEPSELPPAPPRQAKARRDWVGIVLLILLGLFFITVGAADIPTSLAYSSSMICGTPAAVSSNCREFIHTSIQSGTVLTQDGDKYATRVAFASPLAPTTTVQAVLALHHGQPVVVETWQGRVISITPAGGTTTTLNSHVPLYYCLLFILAGLGCLILGLVTIRHPWRRSSTAQPAN